MAITDIFKKKEEKPRKEGVLVISFLKSPYLTEKSTLLEKENKYLFKVRKEANKSEVKKEIERKYSVNVLSVNIINIKRKKRRIGRQQGFKKGFKKAIVQVKEGQKIELL